MGYERVIKYCDLWDENERVKTAGFMMLHLGERTCDISICIQGLHPTDSFQKMCYLTADSKKKELGMIELKEGRGRLVLQQLSPENLGDTDIALSELESIMIPLSAHRQVLCRMGEWQRKEQSETESETAASEEIRNKETESETAVGEKIQNKETESETAASEEMQNKETESEATGSEEIEHKEIEREEVEHEKTEGMEIENEEIVSAEAEREGIDRVEAAEGLEKTQVKPGMISETNRQRMAEDKWKQLNRIYRHVKPFGDGREFLSVGLSDFVLFSEKDYCLVNNSFLLHGFYNYRHLLLGKRVEQGEIQYFLGVPGVFYDEEIQAALYFGFQRFIGKKETSQPGEFGYYIKQIAL